MACNWTLCSIHGMVFFYLHIQVVLNQDVVKPSAVTKVTFDSVDHTQLGQLVCSSISFSNIL